MVLHERKRKNCEVTLVASTKNLITKVGDDIRIDEQLLTPFGAASHEISMFALVVEGFQSRGTSGCHTGALATPVPERGHRRP